MSFIKSFLAFAILCVSVQAEHAASEPVRVIRITPAGEGLPETGQIVIEFDRPMSKMGQESTVAALPITITPEVKGQWQWINEKTLVLNINAENGLKKAEKYRITIKAGMKALDGAILAQDSNHEFTTLLPTANWIDFKVWKTPTRPVVEVSFNMPVTRESIEAHLYFSLKNDKNSRVAVRAISDERDEEGKPKTELKVTDRWLVEPVADLMADKDYELYIEPGIKGEKGSQSGHENQGRLQLKTLGAFRLIGFSCRLNSQSLEDKPTVFTADKPQKENERCNPMTEINLLFSSPILRSVVKGNVEITPDPAAGKKDVDIWGNWGDYSRLWQKEPPDGHYAVTLPSGLKAATDYTFSLSQIQQSWWHRLYSKALQWMGKPNASGFIDEFGRSISEPFSVTIKLDNRKPNFVITHHTAMLEKQVDSDVPLFVNNLKSATLNYKSITVSEVLNHQKMVYSIAEAKNIQYAIPFKIRDLLKGKSGAIYGTLETDPLVEKNKYDETARFLFAQVTPYQVQVKMGHHNTVVWVTDLATGEMVKDAEVTIFPDTFAELGEPKETLTQGITNDKGIAVLAGQETLDPKGKLNNWRWSEPRLFVRVVKGNDMALVPLMHDFEIDTYRISGEKFGSYNARKYNHLRSWGTTAQGIYRAGDKVQYKIYLRDQNNQQYIAPPKGRYNLEVKDPTYKTVYEVKDVQFNEFGAMSGEFPLAKTATIGWYSFELNAYMNDVPEETVDSETGKRLDIEPTFRATPMQMLVSEFTPSPFKVMLEANGSQFQPQQDLNITTSAKLHAGGAFTDADTELAILLQADIFRSKIPVAEDFFFGAAKPHHQDLVILRKSGRLNGKGDFDLTQKIPNQPVFYGKLLIEGKVKDDRGKSVAAHKTLTYIGGDRLVGLKQKEWLFAAGKQAQIQAIIVDKQGNPVAGNAEISVEKKETTAAKVKSAGNVYKTDANSDWKEVAKQLVHVETTPATYSFIPKEAGTYRAIAKTKDDNGRVHVCELEFYVTGGDYILWGDENETYLPVIPEKNEYQVGETARFLVKNPYPKAKALITVERLGVIDTFIQDFDNSSPVIDIPVKPDYMPNFYVSVSVMSPRVDSKPLALGELDLAKPTFRMGYAKASVKNGYKEITVTAKADKEVYKPGEKVKVSLQAKVKHPKSVAEPIELAIVVIDDAVFDLISLGRNYYNPYNGFYQEESLDMRNYSLLNGLVGRMKFAKKGANPGGDGGADLSMRSVFKFVSYWNPSILTDKTGNATVEFEAPDNLTGWRIFAIAMTPGDRMGLGESTFKVNRPTETRPVMPNQIAEGDRFEAGFSIMNRMDKKRDIKVSIMATGNLDDKSEKTFEQDITLEPFKRTTIYMPVMAGSVQGGNEGNINFVISAGDEVDQDKMIHSVPVKPLRIVETKATFGTSDNQGVVKVPVVIPDNVYPDATALKVTLSPSIIGHISGIFSYMKNYPYTCWEQKVSRAIVAASYPDLRIYLEKEAEWPKSNEFVKGILEESASFQASNGGMAYFKAKDEYVDPFLSAFTGLGFAWFKQHGYEIPTLVENRLVEYLQGLVKNDFVEDYYSPDMVATTRAVALEALSYRGRITVADLERFMPHLGRMNAFGKASFAQATMNVEGAEPLADKVIRELFSHFNETATQITLGESLTTSSMRILDTPLRETCRVLEAFVHYGQTARGKEIIGDKATKLAKTITHTRKGKTHFENTQENLYCVRALSAYSKAYESAPQQLTVVVEKEGAEIGKGTFDSLTSPEIEVKTSLTEQDSGKEVNLSITQQGEGRLYYTTRLTYAQGQKTLTAMNAGIEVRRDYSYLQNDKWVLLEPQAKLKRGDLVRVDLYVIAPGDRPFVVVNDPVPGCLEPVNKNLATTSLLDQRKLDDKPAMGTWWHKLESWVDFNATRWAFHFMEMRHDAVRFYSDYLPKGNYYLSYVAQVVADGDFNAGPTTAEEMYNPETFGRFEPTRFSVSTKEK